MRELVFKNMYFEGSKKRDISVEETIEKNGLVATTQKRSLYFIRGRYHIDSQEDLKRWAQEKKENKRLNRKWFHIMRKHSDKDGVDNLLCKARGSFYAIVGRDVYNIVFVHSMKMKMHKGGKS
jgi:hypothetical protein